APSYSVRQAKQSIREVRKELEKTIQTMETADFFVKAQEEEKEDHQGAGSMVEEENPSPISQNERERSRSDLESSGEEEERYEEGENVNIDVAPFLSSLSNEAVDPQLIESLRDMNYQINQEVILSVSEDPALTLPPVPTLKKPQTYNKEPPCESLPSVPILQRKESSVDDSSVDSTEHIQAQNSHTGAIPKSKSNPNKKKDKRDKKQNLTSSDQLLILDSWEVHRDKQTWDDPALDLTFEQVCDKVDTKILLFKILSHQQRIPELSHQVTNIGNSMIILQSDLNDIQTRIGRLEETRAAKSNTGEVDESGGICLRRKAPVSGPCETRTVEKSSKGLHLLERSLTQTSLKM
ncbi:hypothetical protein J6590_106748, partial [Homalodisca vitripennis]